MQVTEIFDVDIANWAPGTRFFSSTDGLYFVVDADLTDYSELKNINVIRRNTVVLYCDETARPTDLTPDHIFSPGTTPEEAIQQMGYQLI